MRNETGLPAVEIIIRRGGVDCALVAIFTTPDDELEVVVGIEQVSDRAIIHKALETALRSFDAALFA